MKIPRYNAQVPLTKQAPGVMVDASAYGQQARAVGEIGNVLTQIGQKLNEVQIDAQIDQAKILGTQRANEAELEASQEQWTPDYDKNNQKRIDAIRQEVVSSVKNPVALQKVNQWLDLNLSNSEMKMRQYGYKKLIDHQTNLLDERIYQMKQKYLTEDNPKTKQGYLNEIDGYLKQKEEIGVLSTKDRLENFDKIKNDLIVQQAELDSVDNPRYVLENLKSKDSGVYKGISNDKKVDLIKSAETRIKGQESEQKNIIKQQEQIIKDKQSENYKNSMLLAFDGQLSEKVVEKLYTNDEIDDSQRSKLTNYLFYHETPTEDNLEVYNEIIQMQSDNTQNPNDINDYILDQATKNNLKVDSAKRLLQKSYNDYTDRRSDLVSLNAKEIRSVGEEFFRNEYDEPDNLKIETAIYNFNRRIESEKAEGNRITEIAQEIIEDTIRKEYPEINQVETINKIKDIFKVDKMVNVELQPPKNTSQEKSPYAEYPDAFKENGVWKVVVDGKKYRIEE